MKKNKSYSAAQKLKAALALNKGDQSAVEVARNIGCHPTIVADWHRQLIGNGTIIFEKQHEESEKGKKIAKLERMIGKLTIQNDFLDEVLERYS